MSENIPESVPTSQDPNSRRPLKRRALSPSSKQANDVFALFANPEQDIPVTNSGVGARRSALPPPPEIVANVQGSSAGAGSGEFHVYKASRRREYERLRVMEEESREEKEEADFQERKEENVRKDEQRLGKNRKRREKQKARKGGKAKAKGPTQANGNEGAVNGLSARSEDSTRALQFSGDLSMAATIDEGHGVIIHDDG